MYVAKDQHVRVRGSELNQRTFRFRVFIIVGNVLYHYHTCNKKKKKTTKCNGLDVKSMYTLGNYSTSTREKRIDRSSVGKREHGGGDG